MIAALAIFSVQSDRFVLGLYRVTEDRTSVNVKILSWVCLGGAIGLSFTTNSLMIEIGCSAMLMGYAVYYNIYSICVFLINYNRVKLI